MEENSKHHINSTGFEASDVDVWAVGKFAIGLAFLCILALSFLFGLFRYFESTTGGKVVTEVKLPPTPQLQKTPAIDLRAVRAAEDLVLNSYGWVDQSHGVVHVPISRAIDLLAQRGLPSRPESAAQSSTAGISMPTESSLGRKMQPPGGPLSGDLK